MLSATISVPGSDSDWYDYHGVDGSNTDISADPWMQLSATSAMQICVWAKEDKGARRTPFGVRHSRDARRFRNSRARSVATMAEDVG